MLTRSVAFFASIGAAILVIVSCAGSSPLDKSPLSPPYSEISSQNYPMPTHGRYLWAYYWVKILPDGRLSMHPVRNAADHWNVLQFLESKPCANCVSLVSFQPSGTGTMLVDVRIRHPFANKNLTGFDVRGIAIFTGTHTFPSSGLTVPDQTSGEGEVVNADGFTSLYNPGTVGDGPGGLQGYSKGKMATSKPPSVILSAFKQYVSVDPANTRNAFYAGATLDQTFEIKMPTQSLGFGYAVDASWVAPSVSPVTDPMTDFPSSANCPEPWKIEVSELPMPGGMTPTGGSTELTLDVYDRSGKDSHAAPVLECPELWSGPATASFTQDFPSEPAHATYDIVVNNLKLAQAGNYKCLVAIKDNESATAPHWLDLTAYQIYTLTVSQITKPDHHELWFYHRVNLLPDDQLSLALQVVQQASQAGYEKDVLSDFKLDTIDIQSDTYWSHLQTYAKAVKDAGMELIPCQVDIGYSDAVMCHDPNLIEGQPVKNAVFDVTGTTADIEQDSSTAVVNGDFENHSGDTFPSWSQMDGAGTETFADTSVKHSGSCSMRFENFTANGNGNDRIRQDLTVKPWQCYAISFWVKTSNVQSAGSMNLEILTPDASKSLEYLSYSFQSTQDWTQYYCIFNSQDLSKVAIYFGIWGGQSGQFWIDDMTVENTGLINLIRRDGCPLVVTNQAETVTYQEGIDFQQVSDPLMGHAGSWTGTFDLYHARPVITLTPGSKIKSGDKILVSYYHAIFVYDMQTACCLTEPAVFDIFQVDYDQAERFNTPERNLYRCRRNARRQLVRAVRVEGRDAGAAFGRRDGKRSDQIAHQVNPSWHLITWSDMYDPNHNAHDNYYLVVVCLRTVGRASVELGYRQLECSAGPDIEIFPGPWESPDFMRVLR